jgi:hypothetical protein
MLEVTGITECGRAAATSISHRPRTFAISRPDRGGPLLSTNEDSDHPLADVDAQAIQHDLIAGVAAELRVDGVEEIGRGVATGRCRFG